MKNRPLLMSALLVSMMAAPTVLTGCSTVERSESRYGNYGDAQESPHVIRHYSAHQGYHTHTHNHDTDTQARVVHHGNHHRKYYRHMAHE